MQNTHLNKKRHRLKNALSEVSIHTIKFARPLLFILMIGFLYFAAGFYIEVSADPIKALDTYQGIFEHLMMSLLLTVGSAVIFDISLAEKDKK